MFHIKTPHMCIYRKIYTATVTVKFFTKAKFKDIKKI